MRGSLRRLAKLGALLPMVALTPLFCLLALVGLRAPSMRTWFRLLGSALWIRTSLKGPALPRGCLLVSNHVGYLDPLVLASYLPSRFLGKAEIARWPVIGWVAWFGDVLFVERDRPRSAAAVIEAVAERLTAGDRVALFPEAGTSPDGRTLAEFRPMLFEASVVSGRPVVPAALCFLEPEDPHAWAWFDDSSLWAHLWTRLLPSPRIRAELRVGAALWPEQGEGRKELAARTRRAVQRLLEGEG